jgi:hypothetical protein
MLRTLIALILSALASISGAQNIQSPERPFDDKPVVADRIHVDTPDQFKAWQGGGVPIGEYESAFYTRSRIGTVSLTSSLRAHIDVIQDTINFPSYFELIDPRTKKLIAKFPVLDTRDAEWYFAGNGSLYLNQTYLGLCGPRVTRKFTVSGLKLLETKQPLIYVGADTEARYATPLFESPTSKNIVATVVAKSKVLVLGLQPGIEDVHQSALLVRTPFGLTGWHRRTPSVDEGGLELYQRN